MADAVIEALWYAITVSRSHSRLHGALVVLASSLDVWWPHSCAMLRSTSDAKAGGWWKYDGTLCLAQRMTLR